MLDGSARRIGSVRINSGQLQGLGVANNNVCPERDGDGMVGNDTIQFSLIGEAFVLQAKVLHGAAMGHYPSALGQIRGLLGKPLLDISDRVNVAIKVAAVHKRLLRRSLVGEVDVGVGETWYDISFIQVDGLRVGSAEF